MLRNSIKHYVIFVNQLNEKFLVFLFVLSKKADKTNDYCLKKLQIRRKNEVFCKNSDIQYLYIKTFNQSLFI